jgi:hypothetical protein
VCEEEERAAERNEERSMKRENCPKEGVSRGLGETEEGLWLTTSSPTIGPSRYSLEVGEGEESEMRVVEGNTNEAGWFAGTSRQLWALSWASSRERRAESRVGSRTTKSHLLSALPSHHYTLGTLLLAREVGEASEGVVDLGVEETGDSASSEGGLVSSRRKRRKKARKAAMKRRGGLKMRGMEEQTHTYDKLWTLYREGKGQFWGEKDEEQGENSPASLDRVPADRENVSERT